MTLAGRLDLDSVEDLAACADQICRSAVRTVVIDAAALTGADEAGARTLATACQCLAAHGVSAWVRGVGDELAAMLDRLGLTLPAPRSRIRQSADLAVRAVVVQRAAGGLGVRPAGRGERSHDGVELPDLLRGDAIEQGPPDLIDV